MGAAYYIVLNSTDPGFDSTVDGKALSNDSEKINAIAKELGFSELDGYCSMNPDEARDMMLDLMGLEDESELADEEKETFDNMPTEQWFAASEGLEYATKLASYIEEHPAKVSDPDAVLNDLNQMTSVLKQAEANDLKWHLQVDF